MGHRDSMRDTERERERGEGHYKLTAEICKTTTSGSGSVSCINLLWFMASADARMIP